MVAGSLVVAAAVVMAAKMVVLAVTAGEELVAARAVEVTKEVGQVEVEMVVREAAMAVGVKVEAALGVVATAVEAVVPWEAVPAAVAVATAAVALQASTFQLGSWYTGRGWGLG